VSVVEEAHRPLIGAPEAFERPVFQRFWVSPAGPVTEAGDSRDPRRVRELDRAVERTLGAGWSVQQIAGSGAYEILPERGVAESSIRMGTVWDEAYALRDVPGIEHASPHFIVERESGEQPGGEVCRLAAAVESDVGRAQDLPEAATNPEWSLGPAGANVLAAHARFETVGHEPGTGQRLGHPDTGYRPYPEIWPRNGLPVPILAENGWDFLDDNADPTDDLVFLWPGHGTKTASVIVSPKGPQLVANAGAWVSGVAPGARLIPLRVTRSVALHDMTALVQAVERAAGLGPNGNADRVDVVSISLGGLPDRALRRAIREAWRRNVIVLAAAGNSVRTVVWPARYREVIAVAATNVRSDPWAGSSRGAAVDIAAPGQSVWCAGTRKHDGEVIDCIGMSSGTSFAVATTAGVALLWLDWHHDDTRLADLRRHPGAVPSAFRNTVRNAARRPSGWDSERFGAGIVDALGTIETPLPAPRAVPEALAKEAPCQEDLATLLSVFEGLPDARLRVTRLLGTTNPALCEVSRRR